MASRPFRILGLQQVALGGLSKPRLSGLWHGLLGVPKLGHYRSTAENVDEDILQLGHGPLAVELDLMEPIDPTRAPKVHQPALNHIGLWVDPLRAAVDHLQVPPLEKGSRVGLCGFERVQRDFRDFRETSERLLRELRESSGREIGLKPSVAPLAPLAPLSRSICPICTGAGGTLHTRWDPPRRFGT